MRHHSRKLSTLACLLALLVSAVTLSGQYSLTVSKDLPEDEERRFVSACLVKDMSNAVAGCQGVLVVRAQLPHKVVGEFLKLM